jgi:riboflavin transporter FmnP
MNTRIIAAVITFAALTIVLNLSPLKFPAPYAPFLIYQVWEIPIVAGFLLYGATFGILVAIMNTAVLLAVFPGDLPTGPFYNLAAVLSMLLGIGIAKFIAERRAVKNEVVLASVFTFSGLTLRTVIMGIVNWVFLRFPPPVGYSLNEFAIIASIPLVMIFNATLALYTIPTGYSLARIVKSAVKGFK